MIPQVQIIQLALATTAAAAADDESHQKLNSCACCMS
jgi:hypothetical protein